MAEENKINEDINKKDKKKKRCSRKHKERE